MDSSRRARARMWVALIALGLIAGVGLVFNPVGEFRLRRTEARIANELAKLPMGSDVKAIRAFCDREGLTATEPMTDPTTYNPPLPARTRYQIHARDAYEAQFFGATARVVVNFWLDENKQLLGTEITRTGSAL